MIHELYCVKDTLVGFSQPFVMANEAVALRSFAGAAQSPTATAVNTNPEHKQLWFVGTFDDQSGNFTSDPKFISDAMPYIVRPEVASVPEVQKNDG